MTTPAAWPYVVAALTTLAGTLPAERVTRGRDRTNELGAFIMVGVSRLEERSGWDDAGSYDQDFQSFGGARVETGTVNILALTRNGDDDPVTASTALFTLVTDLTTAIRATPGLGVAGTNGIDYLVAKVQTGVVSESANDEGAMAAQTITVGYQARIP